MHIIRYNQWLAQALEDADLQAELAAISGNTEAVRDRFAIDLSFGTAGMRGIIGAGTNRINIYTVRRATQGFANYLLEANATQPSVAIGYDSRIKSQLFAHQAACVLAANGISVHLFAQLQPVPCLSFAVRALGCSAGVMITASHNPAEYNGYKVYGADGAQLNTQEASKVLAQVEKLDMFEDIVISPFDALLGSGAIAYIDSSVLDAYCKNVLGQVMRPGIIATSGLSVVYSPLNGAGNVPVRHILQSCGLEKLAIVAQQEQPDGNFPTCPYPNPESAEALELGIQQAQQMGADLMLATDPDADRVGIAVRDATGEYRRISGNEVGVLLLDYICKTKTELGTMPKDPVALKSIVSTPMADVVAKKYGVLCDSTLTGFKYIGEYILQLEALGQSTRFIFGFEESAGYLSGTYVRDKDAVAACMLICEAAAFYKSIGMTLYDAMQALYQEHGNYLNLVESFAFEGIAGLEKMGELMAQLRKTPPRAIAGHRIVLMADYEQGIATEYPSGESRQLGLPSSNVLAYTLEGGSRIIVRPSGTEPKVKVYFSIRDTSQQSAEAAYKKMSLAMRPILT